MLLTISSLSTVIKCEKANEADSNLLCLPAVIEIEYDCPLRLLKILCNDYHLSGLRL